MHTELGKTVGPSFGTFVFKHSSALARVCRRVLSLRGATVIFTLFFIVAPGGAYAMYEEDTLFRAKVIEVVSEDVVPLPGARATVTVQTLRAEVLTTGEIITIENDRQRLQRGDVFFANYIDTSEGRFYTVREPDRRFALALAVGFFALVVIAIGGWIGLRALIALGVSFGIIIPFLLPALATGTSPLLISFGFSALILALTMAITHGINRLTIASFVGSILTVLVAVLAGAFFTSFARLSGFADDSATILNLTTGGTLNMEGLLLGALIIGFLGVIDDLAITQVAMAAELKKANPELSRLEIYKRTMRVGREHLGAVVNTLFLAYAGAAMPLLLLFGLSPASPWLLVNSEIIAVEVVRATVGGFALALALPITSALGALVASHIKDASSGHTHAHHHHH